MLFLIKKNFFLTVDSVSYYKADVFLSLWELESRSELQALTGYPNLLSSVLLKVRDARDELTPSE